MKKITLFYIILSSLLLLSSCTIQKRVYMPGYHVERNTQKHDIATVPQKSVTEKEIENAPASSEMIPAISEDEYIVTASAEEEIILPAKENFGTLQQTSGAEAGNTPQEQKPTFTDGFKKGIEVMMPQDGNRFHGLAVASLILGILSLVAYYGGFVLGLLAIIFGAVAMKRIRNNSSYYKGHFMALAGLICGIIGIAIATAIIVL